MINHTPTRECIGCGKKFPKQELLRVVKNGGQIALDPTGKSEGRGAYLCKSVECLEQCIKRRKLNRAFRYNIPEAVYQSLMEEMGRYLE